MTYKLLHAGFDTLDVAFAGALPNTALSKLEHACAVAKECQEPVLTAIGPGNVSMHVSAHGMRGGFAFVVDTGPLGAKWMFKNSADVRQWNIFASPRATMLLAYGYEGTRDLLWTTLDAMGAKITNHSINRADFAMDFQTKNFELHQDQFVAHSHSKLNPHWGKSQNVTDDNQPSAILRGRKTESVTVGKQPGRQIIVYDKRREAIEKQKYFWFEAWDKDRHEPELEVWRVEVRAGKKELKNKYQIRTFEDFECGIGDAISNALEKVKYIDDQQNDSNVTRQSLHPLWVEAKSIALNNLCQFRSGLTPDQIIKITHEQAINQYTNLCVGNGIGLGIASGLSDEEMTDKLPALIADSLRKAFEQDSKRTEKSIRRGRERLHFVNDVKNSSLG